LIAAKAETLREKKRADSAAVRATKSEQKVRSLTSAMATAKLAATKKLEDAALVEPREAPQEKEEAVPIIQR